MQLPRNSHCERLRHPGSTLLFRSVVCVCLFPVDETGSVGRPSSSSSVTLLPCRRLSNCSLATKVSSERLEGYAGIGKAFMTVSFPHLRTFGNDDADYLIRHLGHLNMYQYYTVAPGIHRPHQLLRECDTS